MRTAGLQIQGARKSGLLAPERHAHRTRGSYSKLPVARTEAELPRAIAKDNLRRSHMEALISPVLALEWKFVYLTTIGLLRIKSSK